MDVEFAGTRVWVLLGPTPFSDAREYLPKLERIAAAGPQYRVGLRPIRNRRTWRWHPDLPCSMVGPSSDDTVETDGIEATLNRLVNLPVTDPIHAMNVGPYLGIGFDHGIGDAHLFIEVVAALTNSECGTPSGYVQPEPNVSVARPMLAVTRGALASGVSTVARDINRLLIARRARSTRHRHYDGGDCGTAAPAPHYATVFVRSTPNFPAVLREFRNIECPSASTSAVLFLALRRNLQKAGLRLTDTTNVLTDLRRYLGQGVSTLANLSTVVKVSSPEDVALAEFGDAVSTAISSTAPVSQVLAAAALRALRVSPRETPISEPTTSGALELTVSDVSKIPSLKKIAFQSGHHDTVISVALPPGGRDHITVAILQARNEIQLTATYFPDLVAYDALREGLQNTLDITGLRIV